MKHAVVVGLLLAQVAGASEVGAALETFYEGEGRGALIIAGLGAASAAGGIALVTRPGAFERGLGWPLLTLGVLEVVGAIVYGLQVQKQLVERLTALAEDPAALVKEERGRMRGMLTRFIVYRTIEAAVAAAGLAVATVGFNSENDVMKGVGLGLIAVALPLFVLDTQNHQRGEEYAATLRVGMTAGGGGMLMIGGRL